MKQMFFWNAFAFSMIQWMLAIWSLVPLPFLNPAWTSGSSQFTYCWNLVWRILSINCYHVRWVQLCSILNILWHCPSLGLEWKLTFSSPVATAEFSKFASILSAALSQHFHMSLIYVTNISVKLGGEMLCRKMSLEEFSLTGTNCNN